MISADTLARMLSLASLSVAFSPRPASAFLSQAACSMSDRPTLPPAHNIAPSLLSAGVEHPVFEVDAGLVIAPALNAQASPVLLATLMPHPLPPKVAIAVVVMVLPLVVLAMFGVDPIRGPVSWLHRLHASLRRVKATLAKAMVRGQFAVASAS